MTEAARVAQAELGPATSLVAFYADGSDEAVVAAGKLTLEMIAETAEWFDGKGDPRAPEAAEKVPAGGSIKSDSRWSGRRGGGVRSALGCGVCESQARGDPCGEEGGARSGS